MNLNEYLLRNKMTTRRFARQIGASLSAANKWRIKERLPRPEWMLKIEQLTKGKVTVRDWYK